MFWGFWPEIIIIVGFLGIITRILIQKLFPETIHLHIDIALILLIIVGVCVAIYRYLSKKRKREIERLKYKDMAKYDASGHISGSLNGVSMEPTSIENWSSEFVTREEEHFVLSNKDGLKEACEEIIVQLPNYPFSYYFLALWKMERWDYFWREDANKALSILLETTSFEEHHKDHDLAMDHLLFLLRK